MPEALPGRHAFHQRLAGAIADRCAPTLAVLSIGLDGIEQGDGRTGGAPDAEAMRVVVARLLMAMRVQDAACRIGDAAFACLLADAVDRVLLGERAGRLAETMTAPLRVGGQELQRPPRPSIGIAIYPLDGATGARLFRRADAARRRAMTMTQAYAFFDRGVDL